MGSKIGWLHRPGTKPEVWNPTVGCTKVSAGCAHCFAERLQARFWPDRSFTDVQMHTDRLDLPLSWQHERTCFVDSMSDLFHEAVETAFIDKVMSRIALLDGTRSSGRYSTFILLTKRASRMRQYLTDPDTPFRVNAQIVRQVMGFTPTRDGCDWHRCQWPLPNLWPGVSVEDQPNADARVPDLLAVPAVQRLVSIEPMLGPVNLRYLAPREDWHVDALACSDPSCKATWVVCGGESGPQARPLDLHGVEKVVAQCGETGTAVFVKQDSALRPGQQGRIPESLWIKQFPA